MLYNYKQFINESRQDIDSICQKYNIKNYIINEDGSIDVDGDVDLSNRKLIELPLRFRNVNGDFSCSYNQLTSLEGAPSSVDGNFNCSNNKLTSLDGCPSSVGGYFSCSWNELTSLEGAPSSVDGAFSCRNNQLTSLDGCPSSVSGAFDCSDNELTSLEGAPSSVGGDFSCSWNKLTSLEGFPTLFRATMVIDISDNPVKEVYDLFSDLKAIEYINETGCINTDTMEVYYIALLDVWEYSGKAPKKPENIKLKHYTLVY